MKNARLSNILYIVVAFVLVGTASETACAQATPPVPPQYVRFFVHYVDRRSMLEKSLNIIGMTNEDVGRSFAVIAGVSHYPRLPAGARELAAAEADRNKLVEYLKNEEFFDEIIVLWDEDMNQTNLSYFLQDYFPHRLQAFPKSRFLFAYSGHGFLDGDEGYLLGNSATGFGDKKSAIDLRNMRRMIDDVVHAGYQVLVLLNSCYAGAFLTHTSFGGLYIPRHAGAHAITAGASQEKAWSDSRIGPGSVFFEKLLTGLGGAADKIPEGGDGIITTSELYAYLRQEVEVSTDQRQNPQLGDLSDSQSEGEFFFLNRRRQENAGLVPKWNPVTEVALGAGPTIAGSEVTATESPLRTVSGTIPLTGTTADMNISGSFGEDKIDQVGGTLRLELSLSPASARYEQIELRTSPVTRNFTGLLSPRFGAAPVPVELSITFFTIVSTSRPSRELPIMPISGGEFQISPFYTSDCGFSCYYLEIIGTWTARGPRTEARGTIRSTLQGTGIGADAAGSVDPQDFPNSVRLKHFRWGGNTGGAAIPDLVNAMVDGIPLRISTSYIVFPGIQGTQGVDVVLIGPGASRPAAATDQQPAKVLSTSGQSAASSSAANHADVSSPHAEPEVGLGENNVTTDDLASNAWSAAVEKQDFAAEGIRTSILVWPKAPAKLPTRLRIFYSSDILAKPLPTFESSTGREMSVSDWSTAENGLTLTIASGQVDENNPVRIKVYAATQLRVAKVVCLSCK